MVALSLESRTSIAGYGLVMKNQDHELPEECIYVAIDQAVDENAPLPIPTEECKSIGDAVGSHVPWPLHLLKLKDEVKFITTQYDFSIVEYTLDIIYFYTNL